MLESPIKRLQLLNYILGALILASALILIRDIVGASLSKKQSRPAVAEKVSVQNTLNKKNLMYYSPLLEKNPFGAPMKLYQVEVPEEKEAQFNSLSNLVLTGTAVGPKNLSYAIFEDRSQTPLKQDLFKYGEQVFNYGTLKKVEKSSVEIEQNSVTYTVSIPEVISSEKPAEQAADTKQGTFAKKIGERDYILDSRRVQKSLENPEQILTDARLLPNIVEGRQEGFKMSEVVTGGIYHSLGLKNGDILLKINGLEISNPEVAMQAMSALKGMNNVSLDIIRNGQNLSMNYRMR